MRHLAGLRDIADHYDGFVIDLWGVVHDGVRPLPGAAAALRRLREAGKRVVLLSNAPRRAARAVDGLRAMEIDDALYDAVVTSGEVTHDLLLARDDPFFASLGPRVFHLGPERDRGILDGVAAMPVASVAEADWVLNTGPDDEAPVALEDILPALDAMRARALPMVCANPDLEVIRDGARIICAGLLARFYAEKGGSVRLVGKPDPAVYEAVLATLAVARARIAMLGDALATDMAGARNASIDGIWVLGGIHAELAGRPDAAERAAADAGLAPVATVPGLVW